MCRNTNWEHVAASGPGGQCSGAGVKAVVRNGWPGGGGKLERKNKPTSSPGNQRRRSGDFQFADSLRARAKRYSWRRSAPSCGIRQPAYLSAAAPVRKKEFVVVQSKINAAGRIDPIGNLISDRPANQHIGASEVNAREREHPCGALNNFYRNAALFSYSGVKTRELSTRGFPRKNGTSSGVESRAGRSCDFHPSPFMS